MAISDLPGYVQGYKFTDSAAFYDSSGNFFIDQAGYSAFPASRLEITDGTPSFVDVNSARGLVLDNTVQGFLHLFPAWHGSMIAVMGAPGRQATNGGQLLPLIGGGATSATSNCRLIQYRVNSAQYLHRQAGSGGSVGTLTHADDGIYASCFSADQENRLIKGIEADGTINSGSAVADNDKGVEMFTDVGAGYATGGDYGTRMRFGNISGVRGSTAVSTDTMIICELHFFDSILTDAPTTSLEAELTALEAIYG